MWKIKSKFYIDDILINSPYDTLLKRDEENLK